MRWRCSKVQDMSEGDTNGREKNCRADSWADNIIPDDLLPTVDYWKLYFQRLGCLYPRRPYNLNLLPLVIRDKYACIPTAINVLMGRLIFPSLGEFMERQKNFGSIKLRSGTFLSLQLNGVSSSGMRDQIGSGIQIINFQRTMQNSGQILKPNCKNTIKSRWGSSMNTAPY